MGVELETTLAWVSTGLLLREAVLGRLQQAAALLAPRGVELEVQASQVGRWAVFACRYGGQAGGREAWVPIVRCHVAMALAEVAVGPLAERWLSRRLLQHARRRRLALPPSSLPKALQLARRLVEGPAPDPNGRSAQPAGPAPVAVGEAAPPWPDGVDGSGLAGSPGLRGGLTGNLLRWQSRISRCLLEVLGAGPPAEPSGVWVVPLEGVVRFRVKEFGQAIDRAAASAVAELAAERQEQRWANPWRSLWLGPAPRVYEVHVLRDPAGSYQVLDRWGDPVAARAGEPAAAIAGEEGLVGLLLRLGPKRIVAHLDGDDPGQQALRSAFPGRVHTCRGCPRCLRTRQGSPRGSL
ncbi:MAG TPA: sporulation protein YtxC [Limnochordales bacterium]